MLLVLVALLFVLMLISASEVAFFSLNSVQKNELAEDKTLQSKLALRLLRNPEGLHALVLITSSLVSVVIIFFTAYFLDSILHFKTFALEVITKAIVAIFLIILFGKMIPKIYAGYNNYNVARSVSIPIFILRIIFTPVLFLVDKIGGLVTKICSNDKPKVSMNDLQNVLETSQAKGSTGKNILEGVVRFSGTLVDEIMKPRIDVVALDMTAKFSDVCTAVITSGFSRFPVYDCNFDNVKGILFVKDLIPHLNQDDDFRWQNLLREPYYVPEHKKINDLLGEFQQKKMHIAIVVDEYGGTLGIVTLEDVMEEVIGEISDESDVDYDLHQKIGDKMYLFQGKTHIGDCERILDLSSDFFDDIKGESDTLAGLILEINGGFFELNDSVEYHGLTFMVKKLENHRILEILVTIQ